MLVPRSTTLLRKVLTITGLRQIGNDVHISGLHWLICCAALAQGRCELGYLIGRGDLAIETPQPRNPALGSGQAAALKVALEAPHPLLCCAD